MPGKSAQSITGKFSSHIDFFSAHSCRFSRFLFIVIARPRFELGSRAPKAPMLGRYNRRKIAIFLHRASGRKFTYLSHLYNLTEFTALSMMSVGSSILSRILRAFFFKVDL